MYDSSHSTTRIKISSDLCLHRLTRLNKVIENPVDGVLIENPQVAVRAEVLFQGLQFQAQIVRLVADGDQTEVREAGLGADGRELGHRNADLIARILVRPAFDLGQPGVDPSLRMLVGVFAHGSEYSTGEVVGSRWAVAERQRRQVPELCATCYKLLAKKEKSLMTRPTS